MQTLKFSGAVLLALAISACGSAERSNTSDPAASPAPHSAALAGTWTLDSAASKIAFASIKSGEVIETHFFSGLTGQVGADGAASVSVPLDQVETKIDLRNDRMRSLFFETDTYPTATIRVAVDTDAFASLTVGERSAAELDGVLSLHGVDSSIYADVFVTRIAPARIEVASSEPVIVHVADFNLESGLEALREIANLPAITPAVPVTFTFVFEASDDT